MALDGIAIVSNGTITAGGSSSTFITQPGQPLNIIVNLTNAPTGTTPGLVVTVSELDPGNGTTVLQSVSTASLTTSGVTTLYICLKSSSVAQVSWTVSGTNPSFGGVYITAMPRNEPLFDKFGNPVYHGFAEAVAAGIVPGVTVGRAQGYVGTSATSGKVIRATTYTPQGTNAQRSVNSTSSSDTSAGTGAQKVTVNFLDATNIVLASETVTMNGTTAVNTVSTNVALLENMIVAQVGSGGGNVGTIQIFTTTAGGGSVWGSIAASDNQTFWAHHYVPSGVTCYILGFTCGATVVAGQTNLNHSGNPLGTGLPQLQIGVTLMHVAAGTWDHDFEVPIAVAGPDLVWLVERPVAVTSSTAVAGFEYMQF